jgi:hypothetical protein
MTESDGCVGLHTACPERSRRVRGCPILRMFFAKGRQQSGRTMGLVSSRRVSSK